MQKKGVLDRDPPRKLDFTLCERKALSNQAFGMRKRAFWIVIHLGNAR